MSITKRLAQLEARQVSISAPKRLIATALEVTNAEPHITEAGGVVTFHSHTLKAAYVMREVWLSEQPSGLIAMVCPRDSGDKVLDVLAEKHNE